MKDSESKRNCTARPISTDISKNSSEHVKYFRLFLNQLCFFFWNPCVKFHVLNLEEPRSVVLASSLEQDEF